MQQTNNGGPTAELPETTAMIVWPTIAATRAGRLVGRWSGVEMGLGKFFTLGKLVALVTIPISLAVFIWQLLPFVCRRYVLTSRRIVIQKGLAGVDEKSVDLDAFDSIRIEVLPGQAWHHAGELVFRHDGREVFRLSGVSRPESFRQVCLKSQTALQTVRAALQQQAAARQ